VIAARELKDRKAFDKMNKIYGLNQMSLPSIGNGRISEPRNTRNTRTPNAFGEKDCVVAANVTGNFDRIYRMNQMTLPSIGMGKSANREIHEIREPSIRVFSVFRGSKKSFALSILSSCLQRLSPLIFPLFSGNLMDAFDVRQEVKICA
jgi:hypothetical protein